MKKNKKNDLFLIASMKFFLSCFVLLGILHTTVSAHTEGEYFVGPRFFSYLLILTAGILIFFLCEAAVKQLTRNRQRQKGILRGISFLILSALAYFTYHYFLH